MSILDRFRLDGKVALVTGCRRGIGKALAVGLAEAGADIIGVSASLESSGSEVEREVRAVGRAFKGYTCDLANRAALYSFIQQVNADFPVIDILVNNAGDIFRKAAVDHADDGWDHVMDINLNAPFILSRELGKRMVARGAGKIIFTASLLSFQGGVNVVSYSVSKGGLAQLTRALANEWASQGVQVNAIAPGYFETDMAQVLQNDPVRSQAILARIPAGRWGKTDELKGAVVFLASSAADYVNGEILVVDGGWMGR